MKRPHRLAFLLYFGLATPAFAVPYCGSILSLPPTLQRVADPSFIAQWTQAGYVSSKGLKQKFIDAVAAERPAPHLALFLSSSHPQAGRTYLLKTFVKVAQAKALVIYDGSAARPRAGLAQLPTFLSSLNGEPAFLFVDDWHFEPAGPAGQLLEEISAMLGAPPPSVGPLTVIVSHLQRSTPIASALTPFQASRVFVPGSGGPYDPMRGFYGALDITADAWEINPHWKGAAVAKPSGPSRAERVAGLVSALAAENAERRPPVDVPESLLGQLVDRCEALGITGAEALRDRALLPLLAAAEDIARSSLSARGWDRVVALHNDRGVNVGIVPLVRTVPFDFSAWLDSHLTSP